MGLALTRQPTLLLYSHQKHKLPESANWGFHTARGRQIFWRWRQIWHDTNEERQKTVQSVFAFVSKFWRRVICVNRPPQSFKVCTADLGGLGDGLSLAWSGALIPPPPRKKENCSLEFTLHLNNDFRALSRDWGAPEPWPDPESVAPPPQVLQDEPHTWPWSWIRWVWAWIFTWHANTKIYLPWAIGRHPGTSVSTEFF